MTDTEQKALALVNEVRAEDSGFASVDLTHLRHADMEELKAALLRAIEQHEAFRQEVSDAVEAAKRVYGGHRAAFDQLDRFIIAKPDPLVEALHGIWFSNYGPENVRLIRAAIEENGGKIVWGEG